MCKRIVGLGICIMLCMVSCASQPPVAAGNSLDEALSGIAAYYAENLPQNTKIALVDFEADTQLLGDYIYEELWIQFEDHSSFLLVERQNLPRIQQELAYQYSGMVSDESMQSIGKQFGPQTLIYGKITQMGKEFRLVVHATDVEQAVTSLRSAMVIPDRRFAALLEKPSGSTTGVSMANVLYSGADNPWKFTVQTDKSAGEYHEGEYMTLRIHSERDAYFKVTHIDVNGNAQVIYPVTPADNNFIKASVTRQIPDNTRFRMTKPYGEETILVGAYEKPFVVQDSQAAPLTNQMLVRGLVVELENAHTEMSPVATANFTYRIAP
ncbi:MAG: DUF4384 domain-containing protein [Treponema sp.]|jgi:hypothetical protein|nr:DUF4384 domain-containing protein [Treponema sp.]